MNVPNPLPDNWRIGVISDTHDRWPPAVASHFSDVDEIWHLGDVCKESILDELRSINDNLTVVLGNNDFSLHYPLTLDLERAGETFHLVHIPPRRWPTAPNWVLFGHTHVPCDEFTADGVHIYNPGSAGLANKGAPRSIGFLVRENGKPFVAHTLLL